MKDAVAHQAASNSGTRKISRFDVQTVFNDGANVRSLNSPFDGLEQCDDHLAEDNGHRISSRVKMLRIQECDFTHPDLHTKCLTSSSRKPHYNGNTISSMQSVGQMSHLSSSLPKLNLDNPEEMTTTLVITGLERLPQKDFVSEVRAVLDIGTFIKEATFLLDLDGTDLDDILNTILDAVFTNSSKSHNLIVSSSTTASPDPNNAPELDGSRASPLISTTHSIEPRNALAQIASYARQNSSKLDLEKLIAEAKKSLLFEVQYQDHKYQRLAKTIKGVSMLDDECLSTDQTWVCAMCSLNSIHRRYLALARLANPVNLGRSSEEIRLIVLVITPTKEKGTKSDIEVGRTIATILLDPEVRAAIMYAGDDTEVKSLFWSRAKELSTRQTSQVRRPSNMPQQWQMDGEMKYCSRIGSEVYGDLKRRLPHYWSDIKEGIYGKNTVRKTISTTFFLYFACLLPSIAFGVLNFNNTEGKITVTHMIIAQTFGGLWNGFFGGQPLIVLLSTAPLALYIKIIYTITSSYGVDFFAMYGCVGLFNSLLLIVYSLTGLSRWMRWSTRSTEEIFALFISIAFLVDAAKDCHKKFQVYYVCKIPVNNLGSSESSPTSQMSVRKIWQYYTSNVSDFVVNGTYSHPETQLAFGCSRDVALLYLLLLLGTVLFALYLFNFTNTPFLTARKREVLRDFALPISVLTMTLIGSLAFSDIKLQPFSVSSADIRLKTAPFHLLNWSAFAAAFGLAIPLSLLFYMEQNIASAIVNSPANKLRKGPANHWDLLMVSLINLCLSVCCLPWVHVALPHSPLHVKALADTEERVEMGHHIRQTIVRVRETRLTTIFSHLLIGLSLLMIPTPLRFIPPAVLNGLFVYMAITAVYDNQLFERILLFITEQSAYPPSHYIRRVPQRKIHLFTLTQLIQLTALCSVGFAPSAYVELVFPFILVLQIVIRHTIIPRLIDRKYLEALDRCY